MLHEKTALWQAAKKVFTGTEPVYCLAIQIHAGPLLLPLTSGFMKMGSFQLRFFGNVVVPVKTETGLIAQHS
jgi:hypothetical protein